MKKIIWVFGQSATGKKTLINKLLNNDKSTLEDLSLDKLRFSACENTIGNSKTVKPIIDDPFIYDDSNMQEDNDYFTQELGKNRRSCIMTDCINLLNSENDCLLIKGQDNDIWPGRGDTVKYFLDYFTKRDDILVEVYILTVEDDLVWKDRIYSKSWFKKFDKKEEVMEHMIKSRLEAKHEKSVIDVFKEYDIPIKFIETGTNHYTIIEDLKINKRRD